MRIFITSYFAIILIAWVGLYVMHEQHLHDNYTVILLMWGLMVFAMMAPSFAKTIITYNHIKGALIKKQVASYPILLIAGYISVWLVFSIIAAIAEYYARHFVIVNMQGALYNPILGFILLLATAIYQFTPLKQYCVSKCRTPSLYFLHHYRYGAYGSFYMGLHLGLYCLGCCIFLMACAFIGGTMNLLWMALFTIIMVLEKTIILPLFDKILGGIFFALAIIYLLYYNQFLHYVIIT